MHKIRLVGTAIMLLLAFSLVCFAETIVLKSGKTIEGKLIEKTDEYIKIDFQGVPLTYFFDEIESIDGKKLNEYTQETTSSQESKNIEETESAQSPKNSFENYSQKQEKQNIMNMLYSFFGYECNFVYNEEDAKKPAYRSDYNNREIENGRKLIDWDDYEVEPKNLFQPMYKMATDELMKITIQRNILTAKFHSVKIAYKQAGLTQRIEDYKIQEININNAINDATVIYTNATGRKKLKVHKKDGSWLIYRDYVKE